jgi:hypothetical protein
VWAAPQREADPERLAAIERSRPELEDALRRILSRNP